MTVRAVPLTLGGKEWALRVTMGGMAAVEDHGITWQKALDQLKGPEPSMRATQLILWSLLQDATEPPSYADVGRWVEPANFPDVLSALADALQAAFPAQKEGGGPPKGRGTGARLSASPTAR